MKTRIPYLTSHRFLLHSPVTFIEFWFKKKIIQVMQYLKKTVVEKNWVININIPTLPKLTLKFCKHYSIVPACSTVQHSHLSCRAEKALLGPLETSCLFAPPKRIKAPVLLHIFFLFVSKQIKLFRYPKQRACF